LSLTVLQNGDLVSGSYQEIKIWNSSLGSIKNTLIGQRFMVYSLAVLQNGDLASGSYQEIKIWDCSTGLIKYTFIGHSDLVTSLTVLQNGDLASGSRDQTIKIWDTINKKLINQFETPTDFLFLFYKIFIVAFSNTELKIISPLLNHTIRSYYGNSFPSLFYFYSNKLC
jgi:WD40 repeat protein